MSYSRSIDHAQWAKTGFLIGLGLFLLGASGEILGHSLVGTLPAWENTLFTYSEAIGIAIAFFSPWIFGVALPLLE
jgi:hypothetical protein